MYTSGSTGQPKGVSIIHQGVVRLVKQTDYVSFSEQDVFLQVAPIAFDAATFEIWGALLNGGKLVLYPANTPSINELGQVIEQYQVTTLWLTAGLFHLMVDENIDALKPLRQLVAGGDVLSVPHVQKFLQTVENCQLINGYGPTENTTFTCCYQIPKSLSSDVSVPIGRAIANTQVYILDQNLQPVPVGVPGELHIGGAGLARGYLNRPELTQEKFIPNPFDTAANSRLYKTGDLARYLPSGEIEYLGRIDNQVKIRGFRIELGEIETILNQHPQVQTSCVIAREDVPGDKRLVAYIVSAETAPTQKQLREYLKGLMPEYMVPSAFVILENLPLTPNGKIDRRALPKPEDRSGLETVIVEPRTPTEQTLAQIWKQVLRVEKLGIQDNFFELGGDSILSIQIISQAKQAGLQLTVKQLFTHQTIAELASVAGTTAAIEIAQEIVTGAVKLTPIQKWFFEQKNPEPHHFNQAWMLTVPAEFQWELLAQIWQELCKHHDALRLRFSQSSSEWTQTHSEPTNQIDIEYFDLSKVQESELTPTIESTANSLQASLNLEEKLVAVAYFHLGQEKPGRLLIIIHHLVVDGVSWRILLEDLQTAYQQLSQGQKIQLPPKTTSFQKWAENLTEYADSSELKSELAYWLRESTQQVSPLPLDIPQGENTVASANNITVCLNETETLALLQEVPKAYKTQINDVLLTALALVLSRWTNSKAVLFNLEGHGREEIFTALDLSRTVGWFTTIFPVQLSLSDSENLGEALKSVKEQLRAIPNKGIGYGILRCLSQSAEIVEQIHSQKAAEISFNYLGQFSQVLNESSLMQVAEESSGNTNSLQGQRSCLLDINSLITSEKLQIIWTYSSNVHHHSTIERIAQEFVATLREIIAHCLAPENGGYTPSDFPLVKLSQVELEQVLAQALTPELAANNWQNIEDIYPLSPMQQGMLFESLYAPESGVYFEQMSCTLSGNINVPAFEQAWQQVVARHAIFRTAFVWESLPQPLQVVFKQVPVKVSNLDWRSLSASQQQAELEALLSAEKQQGFDFGKAPLLRFHLIQKDEKSYEFVWSFHHLLLDGWSLPLVIKDLLNCYQAMTMGTSWSQQPSGQYRHYIAWLQQQDVAQSQAFWRQKLQGFSAPTPLMVDKLLTSRENAEGNYQEQQIHLSLPATAAAVSFVKEYQLTLNNLVQATWALLLSRYSQESDVVFGATVSGRPPAIAGVESMVGLFINTLPVRVQLTPHTQLLDLLKDLQVQLVESQQFSYSSLVDIQGLSDVPRGTSLFESILVFENYPLDSSVLAQPGIFSFANIRAIEQTNYPLTLIVIPGQQLSLRVSYDANRFDDDSISRMLGHFVTLLSGIVAHPQQEISQLPLLTAAEKQQLLVEWNDTAVDYPQDKCLHQLFEEQVQRTPDAVAVVFENEQLTYRELNSRANQLAHYLRSLGVGADVLVGLCVERSLEMVVGLLGILKAGGAYVPLDPEYPQERLSFMLADSQVSVLLTQQHLVAKLPLQTIHLISLDADWETIAQQNQDNLVTQISTQNLAYVIYTSGSTGKPKGVQISHFGLTNFLYSMKQELGITAKDILVAVTTICFDIAGLELYLPLAVGAQVVLFSREQSTDSTKLSQKLLQSGATIMQATPATWRLLLGTQWQGNHQLKILCGGEALTYELAVALLERSQCLWNVYGPTETTIWSTVSRVQNNLKVAGAKDSSLSIGRPIANTQVYILDQNLQPVPVGIPGELHIGGAGLARGYLNRPELTQEKFIPNPFDTAANSRLYKTGDLARYLPSGEIEYLGRIDNQVKIRGFRIELGEIETILNQHPQVQTSCVIARSDVPGDKRLVAYIVPEQTAPTQKQLREYLKGLMPEYMVPSAFVLLESLPLTPNGKIDRRTLPKPDLDSEQQDQYAPPRTPTEEILAQLWAVLLNLKQVGIHDNFFELGGHSLLATQLISRIRSHLQVELPLRQLFAAPTISELAQVIQESSNLPQNMPPIVKIFVEGEL